MNPRFAFAAVTSAALVASSLSLTAVPGSAATTSPTGSFAAARRAGAAADSLVASQPTLFRLSAQDRMRQANVTTGGPLEYVSYLRNYRDLPVIGGDAVVVTDSAGKILSHWTAQDTPLRVDTTPKLTAAAAATVARRQFTRVDTVGTPTLTVVAQGSGVLAYEVAVTGLVAGKRGPQEAARRLYIDANTGRILTKWTVDQIHDGVGNGYYNGSVPLDTSHLNDMYLMKDPKRPGLSCGVLGGSVFTKPVDTWGNGTAADMETACTDAYYAAQQEWDMLGSWLGRSGFDGQGHGFPIYVNYDKPNAQWLGDSNAARFGHSVDRNRQLTSLDMVGHEMGHAVVQATPGGASVESGQNESAGDIFGALTESYANNAKDRPDYQVGESANLLNAGPIRYMYQPSLTSDPDCYSSKIPATEMHAAAGPQNHWFYLLAEGSNPTNGQPKSPTCNGAAVSGIGIQSAGRIFMAGLMRKTSGWTHAKARTATVAAAKELFAGGAECRATKAAWDAVSVPAAAGEVACP